MIEDLVLGLYVPIVLFSGYAVWLLLVKLILPAINNHTFKLPIFALAISALTSLLAHTTENIFYGLIRWNQQLKYLGDYWGIVGAWKVLILTSSIYAVLALQSESPTVRSFVKLTLYALVLWSAGSVVASLIAN